VVVSTTTIAVMSQGRSSLNEANAVYAAARARALAGAATARVAFALRLPNDPLGSLRDPQRGPSRWWFDGAEVELVAVAESGKVDLNAGHDDLIARTLQDAALSDETRLVVEQAVDAARAEGRAIASVRAVLEPCRRLGEAAARLDSRFTVLTRSKGVTPEKLSDRQLDLIPLITSEEKDLIRRALSDKRSPLDDRRLARLRPYLSDGTSVFTVVARPLSGTNGTAPAARRSVFALHPLAPHLRLVATNWGAPVSPEFC